MILNHRIHAAEVAITSAVFFCVLMRREFRECEMQTDETQWILQYMRWQVGSPVRREADGRSRQNDDGQDIGK